VKPLTDSSNLIFKTSTSVLFDNQTRQFENHLQRRNKIRRTSTICFSEGNYRSVVPWRFLPCNKRSTWNPLYNLHALFSYLKIPFEPNGVVLHLQVISTSNRNTEPIILSFVVTELFSFSFPPDVQIPRIAYFHPADGCGTRNSINSSAQASQPCVMYPYSFSCKVIRSLPSPIPCK